MTETSATTDVYSVDPIHSTISFAISVMGVSVFKAGFDRFDAQIAFAPHGVDLEGAIEIDSITIREPAQFRDHVLSDDFLAAEGHPIATFRSQAVEIDREGEVTVIGLLSLRGESHPVTARGRWTEPIPGSSGNQRAHLRLEATIDRRLFGITWNTPLPNGENQLGNDVTVTAELALVSAG